MNILKSVALILIIYIEQETVFLYQRSLTFNESAKSYLNSDISYKRTHTSQIMKGSSVIKPQSGCLTLPILTPSEVIAPKQVSTELFGTESDFTKKSIHTDTISEEFTEHSDYLSQIPEVESHFKKSDLSLPRHDAAADDGKGTEADISLNILTEDKDQENYQREEGFDITDNVENSESKLAEHEAQPIKDFQESSLIDSVTHTESDARSSQLITPTAHESSRQVVSVSSNALKSEQVYKQETEAISKSIEIIKNPPLPTKLDDNYKIKKSLEEKQLIKKSPSKEVSKTTQVLSKHPDVETKPQIKQPDTNTKNNTIKKQPTLSQENFTTVKETTKTIVDSKPELIPQVQSKITPKPVNNEILKTDKITNNDIKPTEQQPKSKEIVNNKRKMQNSNAIQSLKEELNIKAPKVSKNLKQDSFKSTEPFNKESQYTKNIENKNTTYKYQGKPRQDDVDESSEHRVYPTPSVLQKESEPMFNDEGICLQLTPSQQGSEVRRPPRKGRPFEDMKKIRLIQGNRYCEAIQLEDTIKESELLTKRKATGPCKKSIEKPKEIILPREQKKIGRGQTKSKRGIYTINQDSHYDDNESLIEEISPRKEEISPQNLTRDITSELEEHKEIILENDNVDVSKILYDDLKETGTKEENITDAEQSVPDTEEEEMDIAVPNDELSEEERIPEDLGKEDRKSQIKSASTTFEGSIVLDTETGVLDIEQTPSQIMERQCYEKYKRMAEKAEHIDEYQDTNLKDCMASQEPVRTSRIICGETRQRPLSQTIRQLKLKHPTCKISDIIKSIQATEECTCDQVAHLIDQRISGYNRSSKFKPGPVAEPKVHHEPEQSSQHILEKQIYDQHKCEQIEEIFRYERCNDESPCQTNETVTSLKTNVYLQSGKLVLDNSNRNSISKQRGSPSKKGQMVRTSNKEFIPSNKRESSRSVLESKSNMKTRSQSNRRSESFSKLQRNNRQIEKRLQYNSSSTSEINDKRTSSERYERSPDASNTLPQIYALQKKNNVCDLVTNMNSTQPDEMSKGTNFPKLSNSRISQNTKETFNNSQLMKYKLGKYDQNRNNLLSNENLFDSKLVKHTKGCQNNNIEPNIQNPEIDQISDPYQMHELYRRDEVKVRLQSHPSGQTRCNLKNETKYSNKSQFFHV